MCAVVNTDLYGVNVHEFINKVTRYAVIKPQNTPRSRKTPFQEFYDPLVLSVQLFFNS